MFITDAELRDNPDLRDNLRIHMARINHNAKLTGTPTFKVGGPFKTAVRLRAPDRGHSVSMHKFVGGEEFRVERFMVEARGEMAGVNLSVILCPVKPVVAAQIASMKLQVDQAFREFPELEGWCELASLLETPEQALERAHERAATETLPSVDETRSSALWGAW